jgi:hypothetical protein
LSVEVSLWPRVVALASPELALHFQAKEAVMIEAETKSPKEGSMRWKGVVQGETLAGSMIWTKDGQAPIAYWFKGTLKK